MGNETFVISSTVANKIDSVEYKPDADGYYKMFLGGFNIKNSRGDIYILDSALSFFEEESVLMRKARGGYLRSEYGHPVWAPGMTREQYISRLLRVDENRVCATIREIKLTTRPDIPSAKSGKTTVIVEGLIKPFGPYGKYLEDSLKDRHQNTAFSIRSLTMDKVVFGVTEKHMSVPITYDCVGEPGIPIANKYKTIGLENRQIDMETISEEELTIADLESLSRNGGISLESNDIVSELLTFLKQYGYKKDNSPVYYNW